MFFRRTKSGRIVADEEPSNNNVNYPHIPPEQHNNNNRGSYGSAGSNRMPPGGGQFMPTMGMPHRGSYSSVDGSNRGSYSDMSGPAASGFAANSGSNRGSYGSADHMSMSSTRGSAYSHASYGSGPMTMQSQGGYPQRHAMPSQQSQNSNSNPRTAAYVSNSYNMLSSDSGVLREAAMHFLPEAAAAANANQQQPPGGGDSNLNSNSNVPQSYAGYNTNSQPSNHQHQNQQTNANGNANNSSHIPDRQGFRESFLREVQKSKAKNVQQGNNQSQRSIKQVLSASARKLGKEVDWNSIRSDVTWDDPAETLGDEQLDFIVDSLKNEGDDIDDISTSLAGAQISKQGPAIRQRHQLQNQNSSLSASSRRSTTAMRRGLLRKMSSSEISIHTHNHRSAKHKRNNSDDSNIYKPKSMHHMMPPPTGLVRSASDSSLVVVPSSSSTNHNHTHHHHNHNNAIAASFEPIPVQQQYHNNNNNVDSISQQMQTPSYNGNSYLAQQHRPSQQSTLNSASNNYQHLEQQWLQQENWSRQSNITAPDQWHRNSNMSMSVSMMTGDLHTSNTTNNGIAAYNNRSSQISQGSFDLFQGGHQHVNVNRLSAMSGLSGISAESWVNANSAPDGNNGLPHPMNRQSWRSSGSYMPHDATSAGTNYGGQHHHPQTQYMNSNSRASNLSLNLDHTILEGTGENLSERESFTDSSNVAALDQLVFAASASATTVEQYNSPSQGNVNVNSNSNSNGVINNNNTANNNGERGSGSGSAAGSSNYTSV